MSKTTERYGTYPHQTSKVKMIYTLLMLLSSEGLSTKQMQEDLGIAPRTCRKELASGKEALELVYGDDVQIVYNRKTNKYYLVYYKSKFHLLNFPNLERK